MTFPHCGFFVKSTFFVISTFFRQIYVFCRINTYQDFFFVKPTIFSSKQYNAKMAGPITVRQAAESYLRLNLGAKYQYLRKKHEKLEKGCIDIFADHGITISLANEDQQTKFLALILHYQELQKKITATLIKNPSKYKMDDVFPILPPNDPRNIFYSVEKYPDAPFIIVPVAR